MRRLKESPTKFQLDWKVESQAVNEVQPPPSTPHVERVVTLAQRLADGPHVLELTGDVSDVKALRVYSPNKFPRPANEE